MTVDTSIRIAALDATFGAVITGVALTNLDESDWRQIEAAFHRFGLLIFPGQNLTPEAQVAFGRRFGRIEQIVPGHDHGPITNKAADGTLMPVDAPLMKLLKGNEGWHTDSSYMRVSAKASCLAAHVVPPTGGETEWADMRAAYDALDEATRARVESLTAYHSIRYSQAQIGHHPPAGSSYGMAEETPPLRSLVKIHPVTGRKALYIGRHAFGIPGLAEDDSKRFLDGLVAFACQKPRTYLHHWTAGDIAIWDNRCLLHRARPYDPNDLRVMWHVRISGEPASETALNY